MYSLHCIVDTLNQEYFNKLYAEYELVCQRCLEELEHLVVSSQFFFPSTKLRTTICMEVPHNEFFNFCVGVLDNYIFLSLC